MAVVYHPVFAPDGLWYVAKWGQAYYAVPEDGYNTLRTQYGWNTSALDPWMITGHVGITHGQFIDARDRQKWLDGNIYDSKGRKLEMPNGKAILRLVADRPQ